MGSDMERFKYPATARQYIRNLAFLFEKPEDMVEFIAACELVQASLAFWLLQKSRHERLRQNQAGSGFITDNGRQDEKNAAWRERRRAFAEFKAARRKLGAVIAKLDVLNIKETQITGSDQP